MPRPADKRKRLLEKHFNSYQPPDRKCKRTRCHHSHKDMAEGTTRQTEHLVHCDPYKAAMREQGIDNEITFAAASLSTKQPTLTMVKLDKGAPARFDKMAAMAVIMGARPFSLFEEKYMREFVRAISGNTYSPPPPAAIGGPLLNDIFTDTKKEVTAKLANAEKFHFILDESTDVNAHRMINLSVAIPRYGSYFIANHNSRSATLNAAFFISWFFTMAGNFVGGDWRKVSGLATDTCNTMRALWRGLEQQIRLQHVFMVPCDSHGLQLLIRDLIIKVPFIKSTVARAQKIAKSFRKATKEYNILREHQMSVYKERRALILSVITRWGSQYGLINAVFKSKEALRLWAGDTRSDMKAQGVKSTIVDRDFWSRMEDLLLIFKPIHEAQKSSEDAESTVAHVNPRWQRLHTTLCALLPSIPELHDFLAENGGFQERRNIQSTILHTAAYWLDPSNLDQELREPLKTQVTRWICQHTHVGTDHNKLLESFWQFRGMRGDFQQGNISWASRDKPLVYWLSYQGDHAELSSLAIRIFELICNSVPSERAWSVMNLIQTPIRGNLSAEKTEKLSYVYMNRRQLDQLGERLTIHTMVDMPEAEQVDLENIALEGDIEGDDDDIRGDGDDELQEIEGLDGIEEEAAEF